MRRNYDPHRPRPGRAPGRLRRGLRSAFGRDLGPLGRPLDRARSRSRLLAAAGLLLAVLLGAGLA
ncbi:hypothetical protein, partial [Kitasatospora sp. LaBMicrA B282]|uniref:hypothetical protein n=1 Tax=Kitasatospora sp. LaBMicrA B282 TaxID=3420949 RepID=UPI003D0F0FFE